MCSRRAERKRAQKAKGVERPALYIIAVARYFIHRHLSDLHRPSLSSVDFQLGMRSSRDLNNVFIPFLSFSSLWLAKYRQ